MFILEQLYQGLVVVLSPLVAAVFLFFKRGRARLGERFGFWDSRLRGEGEKKILWIHAASNGEVRGVLPLVQRLLTEQPGVKLLLTSTSVSGFELVSTLPVETHLIPFDAAPYLRRALRDIPIAALIVSETEIWPGMLAEARRRNTPVLMVNARISDYTANVYRALGPYLRRLFVAVRRVCSADQISVDRFSQLAPGRVSYTGNMKYDFSPSLRTPAEFDEWRGRLGLRRPKVVVLGSLRPGEENIWLEALSRLKSEGAAPACVLAPRHLERVDYFCERISQSGLTFRRFSGGGSSTPPGDTDVLILDTFGALERCYGIASLAFIGGSLVDVGGHNPLEAAGYGIPVAMGPYDSTVRDITARLDELHALIRIEPEQKLDLLLKQVMAEDRSLAERGKGAQAVWRENQGATARVYDTLVSEEIIS